MTVKETENKQKNGRHKLTEAGPGRAKGSKNKFTNLKQAFLDTYEKIEEEAGKGTDVKSLYEWATKNNRNQGTFYQLISKMLPSNVGIDGSIKHEHRLSMADLKKSMDKCKE
ncbi:unnamed protein product [marine sediment metagenome]|uniref:Uncharacterized protein n=1 Tax=marine sediment metagenome TaxID=412755 RepID=X0UMT2_9ZZZZ